MNWNKIAPIILQILQDDLDFNGILIIDSEGRVIPNLSSLKDEVDSFTFNSMTAKDITGMDSLFNRSWSRETIAYKMILKFKSNAEYVLYFSIDAISSLFKRVEEKEKQLLLNG